MIGRILKIDRVLKRANWGICKRGDLLRLRLWFFFTTSPWTYARNYLESHQIRSLERRLFGR